MTGAVCPCRFDFVCVIIKKTTLLKKILSSGEVNEHYAPNKCEKRKNKEGEIPGDWKDN